MPYLVTREIYNAAVAAKTGDYQTRIVVTARCGGDVHINVRDLSCDGIDGVQPELWIPAAGQGLRAMWAGMKAIGARGAGSRALVPMVESLYNLGTVRTVAGYEVWGNAGLVGSTYNVNVLGLYATNEAKGLASLVSALRAEASAAGANQLSIGGYAIINPGIAGLSERAAARFGLELTRVNADTILLRGPVIWP